MVCGAGGGPSFSRSSMCRYVFLMGKSFYMASHPFLHPTRKEAIGMSPGKKAFDLYVDPEEAPERLLVPFYFFTHGSTRLVIPPHGRYAFVLKRPLRYGGIKTNIVIRGRVDFTTPGWQRYKTIVTPYGTATFSVHAYYSYSKNKYVLKVERPNDAPMIVIRKYAVRPPLVEYKIDQYADKYDAVISAYANYAKYYRDAEPTRIIDQHPPGTIMKVAGRPNTDSVLVMARPPGCYLIRVYTSNYFTYYNGKAYLHVNVGSSTISGAINELTDVNDMFARGYVLVLDKPIMVHQDYTIANPKKTFKPTGWLTECGYKPTFPTE